MNSTNMFDGQRRRLHLRQSRQRQGNCEHRRKHHCDQCQEYRDAEAPKEDLPVLTDDAKSRRFMDDASDAQAHRVPGVDQPTELPQFRRRLRWPSTSNETFSRPHPLISCWMREEEQIGVRETIFLQERGDVAVAAHFRQALGDRRAERAVFLAQAGRAHSRSRI